MSPQVYAAQWVLPVDAPPISNGEIIVEDGVIAAVRERQTPAADCTDLGPSILMPGLVNVHTHLEYTALRGFLEDVPFFPWIRALTALKAGWDREDWLWSTRLGALECIASGTTTIGDNTDAGTVAEAASESGLRAIVYQELFGVDSREPAEPILANLRARLGSLAAFASDRITLGISPHALYTVNPKLFAEVMELAARESLPISFHLAESADESELTERGQGAFAEMYRARGVEWDIPRTTPTRYAASLGALNPAALAVHCVQQTSDDIALLAASGAAIAHCPKSNAKLGAGIAPLARWLAVPGLRVGLGTDSAVSNNTLDLFEEMRFALLAQRAATRDVLSVTARQIVRMATLGGAEALGLASKTGSLTPGKRADLIAVRIDHAHAVPATDPYAALVYSSRASDISLTVVDGRVLYENGSWRMLDSESIIKESTAARARLNPQS